MNRKNLIVAAFAFAALTATAACGTEPDLGPGNDTTHFVIDHTPDQISGAYGEDGIQIDFLFKHVGHNYRLQLKSRDGFTLVDITLDGTRFSSRLLESHYVDGAPSKGTNDALADLAAMPEMQLVAGLGKELHSVENIDPALLRLIALCPVLDAEDDTLLATNTELERN